MNNVVITGANRGIGLELAKLYSSRGDKVYALVRTASPDLLELPGLTVFDGIDVTDHSCIDRIAEKFENISINLLINNAGIFSETQQREMNYEAMRKDFEINAVAPMKVTTALLSSLAEGARVAMISSRMGSIADNSSGGFYAYRMSKAALNAAAVSLAQDLKALGVAVGIFHPGFVKTRMTGFQGDLTPQQSAQGLQMRIDELNLENAGRFIHSQGELLPW